MRQWSYTASSLEALGLKALFSLCPRGKSLGQWRCITQMWIPTEILTQIVQNIYKKLAAFSARQISWKILGTFLPEARTCFCSTVAQCTSDFPDSCVSASYRLCSGGGVVEVDGTMQHVNHSVWKGKSGRQANAIFSCEQRRQNMDRKADCLKDNISCGKK